MLEKHIANKCAAYDTHEKALQNEATLRRKGVKAFHGHSRHGYQTGWVGALVRIVTHCPPDQLHDPLGVGPSIRDWTTVKVSESMTKGTHVAMNKKGVPQPGQAAAPFGKFDKSGGKSAGYFYSPDAQEKAIQSCLKVANLVSKYKEAEVKTLSNATHWLPFNFLYVEDQDLEGGYGVSFKRTEPFNTHSRDEVLEAIDDFLNWTTLEDYANRSKIEFDPRPPAQTGFRSNPYRFPTWGDLLAFLCVEQTWMKGVHAELQRQTTGGWTLLTIFPVEGGESGFVPGSFVPPTENKADFKDCNWTGGMRTQEGLINRVDVPSWAND